MDGIKGKRSEFTADLIFLVAYEKESFWQAVKIYESEMKVAELEDLNLPRG